MKKGDLLYCHTDCFSLLSGYFRLHGIQSPQAGKVYTIRDIDEDMDVTLEEIRNPANFTIYDEIRWACSDFEKVSCPDEILLDFEHQIVNYKPYSEQDG